MKNLITIVVISFIWAIPGGVKAQINEAKMDKDLRVASGVLSTLVQGEDNRLMYGGDNTEGNYLEGYGVIFSINTNAIWVSPGKSYAYSYGGGSGSTVVVAPKAEAEEKAIIAETKQGKQKLEETKALMVDFLADYSQMIGQLKPTDKIVVSTKKSDMIFVMRESSKEYSSSSEGMSGVSAELLKKDQNDYIQGKITRDQLIAKIKVTENTNETSRSKDLDLFGSMLRTVYNEDYTDTYFMSWKPEYEKIEGVGAIYSFKVFSSYDEDGGYRMPGIDQRGLNEDERSKTVEKLYPEFIEGMKENIVQYGRTINSLKSGEMLILKITLTKCTDCSIPKKIQFSVKQSVLKDFNSGKIKQEAAISQVSMKELK